MKISKPRSFRFICVAAFAACTLLPALTSAGDLTGTNKITGYLSSANGFENFVPGSQAFVSGQQSNVGGDFNSAFGFGHIVRGSAHLVFGTQHDIDGGGNAVYGFQNRAGAPSLYNFVTGSFNIANGANAWVGGSNNTSTGNRSLLFGQFLNDGALPGSVMLSDSNPFNLRTAVTPFTNNTPDTFNGTFNRGYFLFTNDGQGANPGAGLFVVPTPSNSAVTSNPAFVGINTTFPTAALDVVGNAVVDGGSVVVGEESLRTLRGNMSFANILHGQGFSATEIALGHYRIVFDIPFTSIPTVVATAREPGMPRIMQISEQISTTQFEVKRINSTNGGLFGGNWTFIVTGPR